MKVLPSFFIYLLAGFSFVSGSAAQEALTTPAGTRQSTWVSFQPVYQSFKADTLEISESSVPLLISMPVGPNVGLAVQVAQASARGKDLSSLSGLTDAQLHLSYAHALGEGSLVASMRVNIPNGTEEFTRDEFATLRQLALNQFNFQVPGLGAGFGISPGVTFAFPIGKSTVIGFGAAYQHRGAYKPIKNMIDSYKPGNEILFTGGLDIRLSSALEFTIDATYTLYDKDKIGGEAFFEAGDKVVTQARFQHTHGFNSAWVSGLYRSRAKNALTAPDGDGVIEEFRTLPDQVSLKGGYRARMGRNFYLNILGNARFFGETAILPDVASVYGAGAGLEIPIGASFQFPLRAMYYAGDLSGIEVSLGLRARLSR